MNWARLRLGRGFHRGRGSWHLSRARTLPGVRLLEYWCHERLGWRSPRHFSCCIPRPKSATYLIIIKKGLIHLAKLWKEQAVLPHRGVSIFSGFTNTRLSQISTFFFFFDVDPPSGTGLTAYLPRSCWQDWRALTVAAPSPPKAMLRSSMVSVPSLRRTRMPAFTWAQALCWHCACRKADTNSPCGGKCRQELLHVSTSEHGFCFSVPLINHLDPTERDTKDTWHHLRATWLPSPSN